MAMRRNRIERELGDDGLDRYNELSPISNLDDVGGPLHVIQGEPDWLTNQMRDFVSDTRERGANIEYKEPPGVAHWTRTVDRTVQLWRRIEQFLERTLS